MSAAGETMRVYVHSTTSSAFPAWVEHTFVLVCATGAASPTVRRLKQAFKEDFFKTHFSKDVVKLPIMTQGVLRDASGKELRDEVVIADALEDREDVFFALKGEPAPAKPAAAAAASASAASSPAASSSSSSSSSSSQTVKFQTGSGEAITLSRAELASIGPKEQLMFQQLSLARDLQSKGQLRKARDIYSDVLKSLPTGPASSQSESAATSRQICHQQLGVIYLYNRFFAKALPCFEAAVKIVTTASTGASSEVVRSIGKTPQLELAQLISLVGQCHFGLNDFAEAGPCFERALKLLQPKGEEPKDPKVVSAVDDNKVWLARTMYRGTTAERSQALATFEAIIAKNEPADGGELKQPDSPAKIAAMVYYAQIAIDHGKQGDVIPYLLRALVASQAAGPQRPKGAASYEAAIHSQGKKSTEPALDLDPQLVELVQVLLTDLVSKPGGVALLLKELHAASNNHSALTFLAQTLKDQGGVTASIEIYRRALAVCNLPARPRAHLLLNLVHTMELEYQYQDAFDLIKSYFRDHPGLTAGSLQTDRFYEAIQAIGSVFDVRLRTNTAPGVPAFCEIGPIFDMGTCHVTIPQPGSPPPKKSTAVPYPADELNIMALMFTAVKMLYVCGGLQVLPTLINMLEPLRVERDLHLTQIRNEHAYYSSIAQMLFDLPYPLPEELASCPPADTIYVCGDSHSMSAAWQVLTLASRPRPVILQPKLVTGLKCWHLRPACRFYPKRNFEAAMRSIPTGATVLALVGEIDSREGILVACEKGRYESVEQGIQLAVDVYITALQEQMRLKSLRAVYVHPITPVLDVTRPTVKKFTQQLKDAVARTHAQPQPLVYLDFFSQLLTPDAAGFNMDYHMDSTHLRPTYVRDLLQPALERVDGLPAGQERVVTVAPPPMSTMDAINAQMLAAGSFPEDDVNGMD